MAIRQKVLVADSDREFCDFLSDLLSECGYEVLHAATGEEATHMASSHCPELMLMEVDMLNVNHVILRIRKD